MSDEIKYEERSQFYQYELVDTIDVPFVKSLIGEETHRIIEIPCGTGRIAFEIADEQHSVTAADIEPAMIEQLKKKLEHHPLKAFITPKVADMCKFDFEYKYDLMVVPREAFQLIPDDVSALRALNNFKKHLNQNGQIMIDLYPFGLPIKPLQNIELRPDYYDYDIPDEKTVLDWEKEVENGIYFSRYHKQSHSDEALTKVIYYFKKVDKVRNKNLLDLQSTIELKNYTVESFVELCNKAHLTVDAVYGDYNRKEYEYGDPRMLFLLS